MALIPEALASTGGTGNAPRLPVNGDTIANCSPTTNLVFKNVTGSPITVTVTGVKTCSQGFTHDLVASVAAGAEEIIGPIDSRYAANASGLATVNYTGTLTACTVYTTRV
jgi:hypothetical protein